MNIEWNVVTWYSKLLAIIFFILVLPIWTFYLGMRYEEVVLAQEQASIQEASYTSIKKDGVDTKITTTISPKGISLTYIYPKNTNFVISEFPDATFTVNKVVKAEGPIQEESGCNSVASKTFLTNLYMGNSGLCLNLSSIDNEPLALVAVDVYISNDGSKIINGNLIQLLYTIKVNGKDVTRLAQTYLPFTSYSVSPSSSRVIRVGFMVPANQTEFSLTYGYVGVKPSDGENFLGAGQGGYTLNFLSKTLVPIQG